MPVFAELLVPKQQKNLFGTRMWDKHPNKYLNYKNKNDSEFWGVVLSEPGAIGTGLLSEPPASAGGFQGAVVTDLLEGRKAEPKNTKQHEFWIEGVVVTPAESVTALAAQQTICT